MRTGEEQTFVEDVGRKARWFEETRGRLSLQQRTARWHAALEQIDRMRQARSESLDPGEAPAEVVGLVVARKRAKVTSVDNPYAAASEHFASDCAQVSGVDVRDGAVVTLRLKRGVRQRLSLDSVGVFVFNDKTRQWNLVERSGLGAGGRYVWGLAHRDGIYAAIALPEDAREVALERIAYHYVSAGVRSGEFARAADYFDRDRFRRLVIEEEELDESVAADKRRLSKLMAVHRETRSFKDSWRGPLPNGGPPEWQLLEHHAQLEAEVLTKVGIADLIGELFDLFRLRNVTGRWYPLGPRNINGRVKSLAIHPTQPNVLYAGAANGGVWKSTTSGQTWRSLWKFQDTMAVGSIAVSKSSPQTIYAATGEDTPGYGNSYGGVGVYKSTNGGNMWVQKGSAADVGSACNKVLVHPSNANTVYVASNTGVHKSINGGDGWSSVLGGRVTDLVMAHDHPNTLYAGVHNDGVYKTTNGGDDWDRIESETVIKILWFEFRLPFPRGNAAGWIKLALGRSGPAGSNFIVAKLGDNSATTLASNDGGASWYPLGVSEGVDYDEWCSFVAINPSDSKRIHVGSVWMKYTTNGWQWQSTSGTHADHHQIVYDPTNPATCYAACDGGVYKSTNWGATWQLASDGLQATQLLSLGVAQTGSFVVGSATQDQGIIQSEGTSTWKDWGGGNEWGMYVVDPNDSDNIFISPGGGQLRRSTDRGKTYTNPTTGLTDYWASQNRQTQAASFAHVAVQPGNSNVVIAASVIVKEEVKDANGNVTDSYAEKPRLYHSVNGGQSWTVSLNLPSRGTRVAYAHNGARAYAATADGRFYKSDACGLGGWVEAATGTNKPPAGNISCITVDPDEPDVVYITYSNRNPHVLRSTDGGAHWTSVSGSTPASSLPNIAVSSLVVDPENDDVLYVATDIGVFRTNDGGATWYFYNDSVGDYDLPKVLVTALAHKLSEDRLFAATMGRGLYYTYTSGIPRLRVVAVSHWLSGLRPGIEKLRVTDGQHTWEMTRAEVIRRIEAGTNVYTRSADGYRGEVQVRPPDDVHPRWFLRTAQDATKADNLLSLPEF